MDPAYGYLLGAIFKIVGVSPFTIYALQCLLDTATAFGIVYAGRLLRRPRAGVYGALLYAVCATALMFSTAVLKEVWVTSFVTWWVVCALRVISSERLWSWMAFGVYCGIGVGFRYPFIGERGVDRVAHEIVGVKKCDGFVCQELGPEHHPASELREAEIAATRVLLRDARVVVWLVRTRISGVQIRLDAVKARANANP